MSLYYITNGYKKEGPFSIEELVKRKLNSKTLIWKEGFSDWININEIPEFQVLNTQLPPLTPSETLINEYKEIHKKYIMYPIIFGIIISIISLYGWSFAQSDVYSTNNNFHYEKYLDNSLGYRAERGGETGNEKYFYDNTKFNLLRPFYAATYLFDKSSQIFVGKNENLPFITFGLFWILFCVLFYSIITVPGLMKSKNI